MLVGLLQDMTPCDAVSVLLTALDYVAPVMGYKPADLMRECIGIQEAVESELGLPEKFPDIKITIREKEVDETPAG